MPFVLLAVNASAQSADSVDSSVIVSPQAPAGPAYTGGLGSMASEAGKSLKDDLTGLQQNLAILHDLNSPDNQQAINRLGENYGNIKNLGSNLGDAIIGIDTGQMSENSEKLSKNIQGTMDAYGSTSEDLTTKLSAAVKNSPYSTQNPPDQAGAKDLESQAKQMANAQAQQAMPVLGIKYTDVMKLDNSVSTLNANVVSVTKTYLNLIKLTNESPSALTDMSDLSTELATVNGLAAEEIKPLSSLNDSMAAINNSYSQLNEDKVPVKDGVAAINDNMEKMSADLSKTNDEMALSLGQPEAPANTSASATTPASSTP